MSKKEKPVIEFKKGGPLGGKVGGECLRSRKIGCYRAASVPPLLRLACRKNVESFEGMDKMLMMTEAIEQLEFGSAIVASLPKKERSRYEQMMDRYRKVKAIVEKKGMIIPAQLAAKILCVSRQRLADLYDEGRIERVDLDGHVYVTEDTLVAYAQSERKAGRPSKFVSECDKKGPLRAAISLTKEVMKKAG
jgi:hypothetical protein